MTKKAVLFDLDGTLANTQEDVWRSLDYAAKSVLKQVPASFRSNPQNLSLPLEDIWNTIAPEGRAAEKQIFLEQLALHYNKLNPMENTEFYPGILQLLESLKKAGNALYIVTNKKHAATSRLIYLKKWELYFDAWFCPDGPGNWQKSKAELIAMLLHQEQLPRSTPYIGDSAGDVIAARVSGLPVIGVTYGDGDTGALLAQKPDAIAHHPNQLEAILLQFQAYFKEHCKP